MHIGSPQHITSPELSEAHTISHPQISQIYVCPVSALLAFFVFTFFFGLEAFVSDFIAIILPLSFHHEDDVVDFDAVFLAIKFYLHPYKYKLGNAIIYKYRLVKTLNYPASNIRGYG